MKLNVRRYVSAFLAISCVAMFGSFKPTYAQSEVYEDSGLVEMDSETLEHFIEFLRAQGEEMVLCGADSSVKDINAEAVTFVGGDYEANFDGIPAEKCQAKAKEVCEGLAANRYANKKSSIDIGLKKACEKKIKEKLNNVKCDKEGTRCDPNLFRASEHCKKKITDPDCSPADATEDPSVTNTTPSGTPNDDGSCTVKCKFTFEAKYSGSAKAQCSSCPR